MIVQVETIILYFLCFFTSTLTADNCHSLSYDGDVPKGSDKYVFETITTFPYSMMAFCTNRCVDNLECVALDVCDFYGEEKSCRLVGSLKINLTTTDNGKTCQRYKMDKRCGDGELNEEILKRCILYLCDFETTKEISCFLTETTDDIFNWSRKSGKTGSSSTGPNGAKVGTYYKFIEASSSRVKGDNAKLVSNKVFEDKAYCLSMYYHMYGQTTGTLKIQTKTGNVR